MPNAKPKTEKRAKVRKPKPKMLGTGLAEKAGQSLKGRAAAIAAAEKKAAGN